MSSTTAGVHYNKNNEPIKLTVLFEKDNRLETVEFKLENETWVQTDRAYLNNNNKDEKN